MQTNAASYSATNSVYSANSVGSGSSSQAQQAQALAGLALDVMDAALAKLGREMGLSPAQIDVGQATMHAAFGDQAGAAQNCREAANNFLNQQSPTDRSYLERVTADINSNSSKLAGEIRENTDKSSGSKKQSKNFFEVIAEAMGKMLGEKAAKMMKSLDNMEKAGKMPDNTDTTKPQTDDQKAAQAQEFALAQTQFSADSNTYNMVSNLVNTAIKTIGEAMSTLARK